MKEIRRVLKQKGRLVMLEHVRSEHWLVGPLMDLFNPLSLLTCGANINRRIATNLKRAGFGTISVSKLW